MKQYLLAVHSVDGASARPEEENQQAYRDVDAFNTELQAAGAWVFGGGLYPPSTATVVTAADLDAALDWAAKGSAACREPVEVRPFHDEAAE